MKNFEFYKRIDIRSQQGLTLIELIVVLVLVGLIFPTIFSLAGTASVKATKYMYMQEANYLAEEKLEEIVGYKAQHWDWYKHINKFVGLEQLNRGFVRSVSVQKIQNWGKAQIDCWQVVVTVTHPQIKKPMVLSVRLTKYFEYGK